MLAPIPAPTFSGDNLVSPLIPLLLAVTSMSPLKTTPLKARFLVVYISYVVAILFAGNFIAHNFVTKMLAPCLTCIARTFASNVLAIHERILAISF